MNSFQKIKVFNIANKKTPSLVKRFFAKVKVDAFSKHYLKLQANLANILNPLNPI
jgi:hypothetical protein